MFSSARRLRWGHLALAIIVSLVLSILANFYLFSSPWLMALVRWGQGLISGTLIANLLLIAIVLVGCLGILGGANAETMGLRAKELPSAAVVTFLLWLGLNGTAVLATMAYGQPLQPTSLFAPASAARFTIGNLLGQLFGNALYEEVLFRGVVLVQVTLWLTPRDRSPARREVILGLLISQAIFSLQHIPNRIAFHAWNTPLDVVSDLASLWLAGLFFAGVYLRTQNLLIAVGTHTLANLPTLLVRGPNWVHPVYMAVAMIGLMAIGRIGPRGTSSTPPGSVGPIPLQ